MNCAKNSQESIAALINNNQIDEALKILTGIQDGSAWMTNAMAVCQMRVGKPEKACASLMDLVYKKNSVVLRQDSTDQTKLNLATAMFLAGNIDGALGVLNEVATESVMKKSIQTAYTSWKKRQSIPTRLAMLFGIFPNSQVRMDFAPGYFEAGV